MAGLSFHGRGRRGWTLALLLLALLLLGCRSEVAKVGDLSISEEDLSRQVRVSELYFPGSGQKYVALSQLIKGYLSLEVLRSLGHPVSEAALQAEAQRIDRETQAPELLGKIKAVYGSDQKAYLRSFVGQVYGERALYHEIFLPSPEIHRVSREKAQGLLQAAVSSPFSFPEIARKRGAETVTLRVSLKEGIRPTERRSRSQEIPSEAHLEQARRLIGYLSRIQPGQLYPEVIEWPEGYQILRLLGNEGKAYLAQSANIPKRNYEEWFWEQASHIPVRISDSGLRQELLKEVAWSKELHLE